MGHLTVDECRYHAKGFLFYLYWYFSDYDSNKNVKKS